MGGGVKETAIKLRKKESFRFPTSRFSSIVEGGGLDWTGLSECVYIHTYIDVTAKNKQQRDGCFYLPHLERVNYFPFLLWAVKGEKC